MTPQILKVAKSLASLGSDLGLAVAVARELQSLDKSGSEPLPKSRPIVRRNAKTPGKNSGKPVRIQKTPVVMEKKRPGRPKGSKNKSAQSERDLPPAPVAPRIRPPSPQAQAELSFDDSDD